MQQNLNFELHVGLEYWLCVWSVGEKNWTWTEMIELKLYRNSNWNNFKYWNIAVLSGVQCCSCRKAWQVFAVHLSWELSPLCRSKWAARHSKLSDNANRVLLMTVQALFPAAVRYILTRITSHALRRRYCSLRTLSQQSILFSISAAVLTSHFRRVTSAKMHSIIVESESHTDDDVLPNVALSKNKLVANIVKFSTKF